MLGYKKVIGSAILSTVMYTIPTYTAASANNLSDDILTSYCKNIGDTSMYDLLSKLMEADPYLSLDDIINKLRLCGGSIGAGELIEQAKVAYADVKVNSLITQLIDSFCRNEDDISIDILIEKILEIDPDIALGDIIQKLRLCGGASNKNIREAEIAYIRAKELDSAELITPPIAMEAINPQDNVRPPDNITPPEDIKPLDNEYPILPITPDSTRPYVPVLPGNPVSDN